MQCYFKYNPTKPQVLENEICERTDCLNVAFRRGMISLQVMVASAWSVGYGSNKEVTLLYLVPWPSSPTYRVKAQDWRLYYSHHWP